MPAVVALTVAGGEKAGEDCRWRRRTPIFHVRKLDTRQCGKEDIKRISEKLLSFFGGQNVNQHIVS